MEYQLKHIYRLFTVIFLMIVNMTYSQYPGNLSTGVTRGYKVDYYNGSFTSVAKFGAGTANATPGRTGYSNKISGTEFNNADVDSYGMEYTGTLKIETAGSYTFQLTADDFATLYIDGNPVLSATASSGATSASITLPAGNHAIKLKFYELTGGNFATLRFTAVPAGATGFTLPADVDGRFVSYDEAKLTAWYKASDLGVTVNGGGAGIDKVNSWTNKAPDYAGTGTMNYNPASGSYAVRSNASLVNFNPAVRSDGDDVFSTANTIKGLSFRGATKTLFGVANYIATPSQNNAWLFQAASSSISANGNMFGLLKTAGGVQTAVYGSANTYNSAWTTFEPKLLTGTLGQLAESNAPNTTNPISAGVNGIDNPSPTQLTSNVVLGANYGLQIGTYNDGVRVAVANLPEFIYYPWELSAQEKQRVNTYLAIKYGVTLGHSYVNTSDAEVFGLTTNAGYINRIFGIGREDNEALHQKISQSQMTSKAGYDFLLLSKGVDITTTNAANAGVVTNGSYMVFGDNDGALAASLSDLPGSYSSTCTISRLGRAWKAQVTGVFDGVTIRAGSSTGNSFLFPASAAGLRLIIDTDGDGLFATATGQTSYEATSVKNGVATFKNVIIPNGAIFTFAWQVTSPGGVSTGLIQWYNPAIAAYSDAAGTTPAVDGSSFGSWYNAVNIANGKMVYGGRGGAGTYRAAGTNFNPTWGLNNYTIHSSPILTTPVSGTSVSSFLAITPQSGSGFNFRRFVAKNSGQTNDWDNVSSLIMFAVQSSSQTVQGSYRAGAIRGNTSTITLGVPGVYSSLHGNTSTALFANGLNGSSSTYSAIGSLNAGELFLGGSYVGDDGGWAAGSTSEEQYAEAIMYNRILNTTERQQVETYLAIKTGTTLDFSDVVTKGQYLASDGLTPLYTHTAYKNNVFGIGRDDCSGLYQKQSMSTISGDIVTIGLATIVATNSANEGTLSGNRQYLLIGNDGGSLLGTSSNIPASYVSCNASRYIRNWKVQNTGDITEPLQLKIGNRISPITSNWSNVTLVVNINGDNTFPAMGTVLYPAAALNTGVATFNNVILPNGAVFTMVYTLGYPGGVQTPSAATTIGTQKYVNGLNYTSYSISGSTSGRNLSSSLLGLGSLGTDTKLATGIADAGTYTTQAISGVGATPKTYFGVAMTGKLRITAAAATYRFRMIADDQMYFELKNSGGTVVATLNTTSGGTITNPADISLAAGDYDLVIQGANNAGGGQFILQWNGGSGGGYVNIPVANQFAVAPATGPAAWFEADNNLLATQLDAANMNGVVWPDLSVGKNDVTAVGNATYYSTTATANGVAAMRNYNPSIYFTNDQFSKTGHLNGFAYGQTGRTIMTVATGNITTSRNTALFGYGIDVVSGGDFMLHKLSSTSGALSIITQGYSNTENPVFYNAGNANTTNIVSGFLGADITSGIHVNGALRAATTSGTGFKTMPNDNQELVIGGAPEYNVNYDGNINEEIYYPWTLDATERQKVNSYLAIKWGITLDQTTPTSYLSSGDMPVLIWDKDAVGASSFNKDITVIGRDDCGALNQRQSTSTDGADIVSFGNAAPLAVNNASNTNNFTADKSFIAIAHNNGTFTPSATPNLPAILTTGTTTCYSRLDREWQAQKTGTVGNVSMEFGKTGQFTFNGSVYKPVLLVSSTAGDYSGVTPYQPTKRENGIAYFDNVALTTTSYFTIAYIEAAPGGVKTNLAVWFDAGKEVYSDNAGTTPAVVADEKVGYLKNSATNTLLQNVNQSNNTYKPILKLADLNYNPALAFASNGLSLTSASVSSNAFRTTSTMSTFAAGWNVGGAGATDIIWGHFSGPSSGVSFRKGSVYWGNAIISSGVIDSNPGGGKVLSATYTSTSGNMFLNAKNNGTLSGSTSAVGSAAFLLGANTTGTNSGYNMGEIIVYTDDKSTAGNLNGRYKISSYLGLKYGFTQDAVGMNNAYVASDMTPIYNHTTHWNRITGIGRDDCSALEQKQALSQDIGSLVKISTDITNGMAISNALNAMSFEKDKTFLLFGDNNLELAWNSNQNTLHNNALLMPLKRIWRVQETGPVANPVSAVFISVPGSTATGTKLPAATTTVYMLVSPSGDFATAPTVVEMLPSGTDWTVNYDFANGDYYTFATEISCAAPGGISNGLTTWYRTDDLPSVDAGITANNTGVLIDRSGNGMNLTKNGNGNASIEPAGRSSNFNKRILLSGGSLFSTEVAYRRDNLNITDVIGYTEGTMYTMVHDFSIGSHVVFGFSKSGTNIMHTGKSDGANSDIPLFNNTIVPYLSNPTGNNILSIMKSSNHVQTNKNGTYYTVANATVLGASSNNTLRIGSRYQNISPYTTLLSSSTTIFHEAFTYNRALTQPEQYVLDTYMAIKYGSTLAHNYYSPSYDGTNAATTTLYDITSFSGNIFGIGRHIAGCLTQNQSRSTAGGNAGMTVSIDGVLAEENSADTSKWKDSSGNPLDQAYLIVGFENAGGGALTWNTTGATKPALYQTDARYTCSNWLSYEWKVTTTKDVPEVLIAFNDSSSPEVVNYELPPIPQGYSVYMLINDTQDFETNGNQVEIPMTLNGDKWEGIYKFPANTTKYVTLSARPTTCGLKYIITNPATSTQQLKH